MKNYKIFYSVAFLFVIVLVTAYLISNMLVLKNIEEIKVEISGQSIAAEQYSKILIIQKENSSYIMDFVRSSKDETKFGKNISIRQTIDKAKLETFVKMINKLEDEGDSALCCDHPFTIITIKRTNGKEIVKKLSMEPIKIESFFNIKE